MPDPVLAAIIRHLPRRDRVRVERISRRWLRVASTHGWSDVAHFSERSPLSILVEKPGSLFDEASQLRAVDEARRLDLLTSTGAAHSCSRLLLALRRRGHQCGGRRLPLGALGE